MKRVAVVTGGGQGIGKGIVVAFLRAGYGVLIVESDDEAGREATAELRHMGDVSFVRADVSNESEVEQAMSLVGRKWGGLDVLVNNAAIAAPGNTPLEKMRLDEWNRFVNVNLTGAFLCVKHAIPHLRKRRGSIVNVSSTRALMSEPDTEAYSATKGAIVALTHALANSLGPDIRANCVSPGWIAVDDWKKSSARRPPELRAEDHAQHPAGRVGRPDDVAALVLFLSSEDAGFITGANYVVDGGMTRKMVYV